MWPQRTELEVLGNRFELKRYRYFYQLEMSKNGMDSLLGDEPPCRFRTVTDLSYSLVKTGS